MLIYCSSQKPIFSPVTPVAAATVAPIVATNTVPSTTAIGLGFFCVHIYHSRLGFWAGCYKKNLSCLFLGTVPHTQMTSNTIVTMTMASHSSHATAVTSAIPVGEFFFAFGGHSCCPKKKKPCTILLLTLGVVHSQSSSSAYCPLLIPRAAWLPWRENKPHPHTRSPVLS